MLPHYAEMSCIFEIWDLQNRGKIHFLVHCSEDTEQFWRWVVIVILMEFVLKAIKMTDSLERIQAIISMQLQVEARS